MSKHTRGTLVEVVGQFKLGKQSSPRGALTNEMGEQNAAGVIDVEPVAPDAPS